MSRATNLYKHDVFKTSALRAAAVDDRLVDSPDPVTALAAAANGATAMDLTWTNPGANADSIAMIERGTASNAGDADTGEGSAVACSFTDTGDLVTVTANPFVDGDRVVFASVVTTTGVTADTVYFVINTAGNDFQIALTAGGAAVVLGTGDGSGTIYAPLVAFNPTTDTVEMAAHGFANGDRVIFAEVNGTTGITADTSYYVIGSALNSFQLAATVGGNALTLTNEGYGSVYSPVIAYSFVAYVPAGDEAYADSGLTTSTEYDYRVTVLNSTAQLDTPAEAHDTTA